MYPIQRFLESLKKILSINRNCKSVSIDDFAKKKRHTYGTVLIDSKSRKVIDILDSRQEEKVVEWLRSFSSIQRISRDGSSIYARAISLALLQANQISDCFHILKNLTDKAQEELREVMPVMVKVDEQHVKLPIFTNKTRKNYKDNQASEAYLEKVELIKNIQKRYSKCRNYRKVAAEYHLDYRTVKQYVSNAWYPSMKRETYHALTQYQDFILSHIRRGMKRTELFRILQSKFNFQGTYSSLRHFILRFHHQTQLKITRKVQRRQIEKLLYNKGIADIGLSFSEQRDIIQFLKEHPKIREIINLVTTFRIVIGSKNKQKLEQWLLNPRITSYSKITTFRDTVYRDYEAVLHGITEPESNGIAEGKINKIKTIKGIMYGRSSFELLRQKVLQIEYST
ncbi:MAG: transposase [Candidatus Izemoplasmatales bacterium]|nr:transposase [Candidatus Izemoplasmatales bacterium]